MKFERKIAADGNRGDSNAPILVVDDSKLQRRILTSTLARMGEPVVAVETAEEALVLCKTGAHQIIISDWVMPDTDGIEFCKQIRDLDLESYLYFILLTSKSEKDDIAQGLNAGADDFLTKPVNAAELRARLVAGKRILSMQRDLHEQNRLIKVSLDEIQSLYDALDRDLIEARKLQRSLIPKSNIQYENAEVEMFLRSSGRIGGDLVGSYPIGDTKFGLYSIDVSGHGVASALMTARLAGFLSSTALDQNIALQKSGDGYDPVPPAEVAEKLNNLLLEDGETELYFTMCLSVMDAKTGQLDICQAGHPHPALHRIGGSVEFVGDGGMPIGLIEGAEYSETRLELNPGDALLFYSDGVTECVDPGGQMLDDDGLTRLIRQWGGSGDQPFFPFLMDRLEQFTDGTELDDDVSGLLIKFGG